MRDGIKVLFLAANPVDAGYRLRIDEEVREIDEKVQASTLRPSVEVVAQWTVRPSDLQKALLRHSPDIVHFSGHGSRTQGIILEDRNGNMTLVSKQALTGLFRILKDTIKIVFLSACHSRSQIRGLRETIDFTIVMNKAADDKVAVLFASYFYQGLAFGRSVLEAFELAKSLLALEGIDETKMPEMLVRKGINAANVYLVTKAKATEAHTGDSKEFGREIGSRTITTSGQRNVVAKRSTDNIMINGDGNRTLTTQSQEEDTLQAREGLPDKSKGAKVKKTAANLVEDTGGIGDQNKIWTSERVDDLESIRNELKSIVGRLIAGTFSEEDHLILQRALLNGWLVFTPSELDGEVQATEIITGDSNQVRIKVSEPTQHLLQDRLFPPPPGIAPPFPSLIFIGREDALHDVKRLLGVKQKDPPKNKLIIIRGWPGVGKTALISVLGRDPEILKSFPDGVLWTSIGQKPNLISEIGRWGRALGTDELMRAPTLNDATTQLKLLLQHKQMLLIVDDVWEPSYALPFLEACGEKCALLITTRVTALAEALSPFCGEVYVLPVLTEDSAFEFLRVLAPSAVSQHPNECRELIRSLECLPLALHVAGNLLRTEARMGWGVNELLTELKEGVAIIGQQAPTDRAEGIVIPSISALLQRSTDKLDERARECFAILGVFAPKPATFDLAAMEAVWQVKDPKPIVRELVGHGLLEPVGTGRFQVHALLIQYALSLH